MKVNLKSACIWLPLLCHGETIVALRHARQQCCWTMLTTMATPKVRTYHHSIRPRKQSYHQHGHLFSCHPRDVKGRRYKVEGECNSPPSCVVGHVPVDSRRDFLVRKPPIIATSLLIFSSTTEPSAAVSLPLVQPKERRQLELCLVTLLRVLYFAQYIAETLQSAATLEVRRNTYLEARLGCKAILTGRVGGGATGRVYTLGSLQVPGCLEDLEWYARNSEVSDSSIVRRRQVVSDLRRDFLEALASVVEFDGLETLQDPSPRSSLTLTQFNDNKAAFVQRTMRERIIPTGRQLIRCFPSDAMERSNSYILQYYSNELPENATLL